MNTHIINTQYNEYKDLVAELFSDLHELTVTVKNEQLSKTIDDIRSRLNDPFLFVIVGEVKVGKSSFINALLEADKEVCKVAPDPCTDTIQLVVYGEKESTLQISPYLKKISMPVPILQEVAIVDTPGINTIVEHHSEITERFIPISDLIIFVFEAKNPYRQSAWDFFNFISKEWRKKVIFVLQQADLLDPDDLRININGVAEHAKKQGIADPKIFPLSAKKELQGDTDGSGFLPIRDYIKSSITGGNNVRMKLESLLSTAEHLRETLNDGLIMRRKQLDIDRQFRVRIENLLNNAEQKTDRQTQQIIADLLKEYDKITHNIAVEFENGLGVFTLLRKSFLSIFNKKESVEEWMNSITQRIEKELKPALDRKLKEGIMNMGESVKQMAEIIDIEVRKNESVLTSSHQIFGDIANKRQEKLEKLQDNLADFISETETFINTSIMPQSASIAPNIMTGSGLAVLGAILAKVTAVAALDVTGGLIAIAGLSFAGITTAVQRSKIINDFNAEIAKGRTQLEEQVGEKLRSYVSEIRQKIENNFLEFDTYVSEEVQTIDHFANSLKSIETKYNHIKKELHL